MLKVMSRGQIGKFEIRFMLNIITANCIRHMYTTKNILAYDEVYSLTNICHINQRIPRFHLSMEVESY